MHNSGITNANVFDPNFGAVPNPPARYSMGAKIVKNSIQTNESFDDHNFSYNSNKIFVGGLPHGLTEKEFKQYFAQFGTIED